MCRYRLAATDWATVSCRLRAQTANEGVVTSYAKTGGFWWCFRPLTCPSARGVRVGLERQNAGFWNAVRCVFEKLEQVRVADCTIVEQRRAGFSHVPTTIVCE